jgi:hypothetical protein
MSNTKSAVGNLVLYVLKASGLFGIFNYYFAFIGYSFIKETCFFIGSGVKHAE